MLFYRLHNYCKLVKGAKRGAVYNLQNGKVYPLNAGAVALMEACRDMTVDNIIGSDMPPEDKKLQFLERLTTMGLGSFTTQKESSCPTQDHPLPQIKIDFLWLELTSRCNNRCLHCYTGSTAESNDTIPHERWLSLIEEAHHEGATGLQLIGGEPLLYRNWQDLIIKAHQTGYEFIEVFTNATLIDQAAIEVFQKYNVQVATTIYADNTPIHDQVTQHPGSFAKTMAAIKQLIAAGIPLRVASILMKANQNEAENIMNLLDSLGLEATPPDVVRPTGRGNDKDLLPDNYRREPIKPPFFTDAETFWKAQYCNTCLAGKIAVTSTGDVIPCIFARGQVCGNILNTPLRDILNGKLLHDCWHTTKDQVEKCKDCEFRYACSDCRPLAAGTATDHNWFACSPGCSYNPYTGNWED